MSDHQLPRFTGNFSLERITSPGAFPFEVAERDWLISITDPDFGDASVFPKFGRIERFRFWDEEFPGPGATGLFSDQDAERMAEFIKQAEQQQANVWVHCHAGICRSGAVVMVLVDLGWEHCENWHYCAKPIPNRLVSKMLSSRFEQLRQSWS